MSSLQEVALHFAPELILSIGALVVMCYDLAVRGRDGRQAMITGATLVLALIASVVLFTWPATELFGVSGAAGVTRPGAFVSDTYTQFFRVVGALTGLLVLVSGVAFMRPRTPFKGEFFAFLLFAIVAMNLMAGGNDLVTIAVAVEFLSITSYLLTAWLRGNALSGEGALKYFLYGSMASAAMLYGFALMYGASGSTSVPQIAAAVADPTNFYVSQISNLMIPALMLAFVGVGFKIAVVPFHQWSPDAYQGAPTPVTSFLSIGPKAAGFALLIRFIMTVYGAPAMTEQWLGTMAVICVLTMVFANLVALLQTNVKRMMAYSSIAQAGYMLIGVASVGVASAVLRTEALGAVLVYVFAYLFTNAGAFAVIIAVEHASGSSELTAFDGLMKRSPLLAVSMFIFFLSLVGLPPLAGFIGKYSVFKSALAADLRYVAIIGVITGVIAVGYYFNIVRRMFFVEAASDARPLVPSAGMAFVVVACLVMTLVIGLNAGPFINLANQAAATVLPAASEAVGALPPP